jgi:DNA-binding transcriptional LysR family regulator
VLVASPEYLRIHGEPKAPADLGEHQILMSARRDGPSYARWQLTRGAKAETVFVVPRVISREGVHMHEACLNGAGICRLLDFSVGDNLRRGYLKLVLPNGTSAGRPYTCSIQAAKMSLPASARS